MGSINLPFDNRSGFMSIFFIKPYLKIHIDISFLKEYQSFDDLKIKIPDLPDEVYVYYLHNY